MRNIPLVDEHELLAKIATGDQRAFTILFEFYERYVYTYGKKLTRSDDQAVEIVQEVFLKLWINREKLGEVDNFGAYLNRVAKNHALNVLRQLANNTRSTVILRLRSSELDDSTSQQLDYNESNRLLTEALENLPQRQRTVYKLCHMQGLKYETVAEQLHISPRTVQAHMTSALKAIRKHFKAQSGTYPMLIAVLFKLYR
jgi:RNA polymerase sigma-70 factor (ECF subfamily)